jgi:hypothetical protein
VLPIAADAAPVNPCEPPAPRLLCPNLVMPPAFGLRLRRTAGGRSLLLMDNRLTNVGRGPVEIRGRRSSLHRMDGVQVIHRRGGPPVLLDTGARLTWKYVDGYRGSYWKFKDAARFELWRMNRRGYRTRVVAVGPKLDYCLRDLFRQRSWAGVPRHAHYPACSQDIQARRVTLGISRGWADGYPNTYPENWIDVTGRRGCHVIVQRADPRDMIAESDEHDNTSTRVVRLPYRGHGRSAAGACPRYRGPAAPS